MNTILQDPPTLALALIVTTLLIAYIVVKIYKKVDTIDEDEEEDLLLPVEPWYRNVTDPAPKSEYQKWDRWGMDKHAERKATPIYSGVLQYFPDALWAIAQCSQAGNDQHNPNEPLHWSRGKSDDHHDALTRHLFESGKIDGDGIPHSAKMAWRALAILQLEIEKSEKSE